jgi:hypothetical protein
MGDAEGGDGGNGKKRKVGSVIFFASLCSLGFYLSFQRAAPKSSGSAVKPPSNKKAKAATALKKAMEPVEDAEDDD